jgi:hypothetical protein
MVEDLERILNSHDSEIFGEDLYLVKKIDLELLREGFRILYTKWHHEDMNHLLKSYTVL